MRTRTGLLAYYDNYTNMKETFLRINAAFLYLFLMSLPGAYWLITTGTVGVIAGLLHAILGLAILAWYTRAVLIREATDTTG